MEYRSTINERYSSDKGTNLLELFEEDDSIEEDAPELVQVYLRLKPSNVPSSLYEVRGDHSLITSVDTATAGHGRRTQHNVSKMYTFSHIFGPDTNQKEIFEHVVKGNLRRLPEGNNFTLLTYGASGSGKTYTLMGTVKAPGLVPRSLEYVFKVVEAAQMPLYRPGEIRANRLTPVEQEHELQWVRHLRHVSAPLRDKYRRMSTRLCSDMTRSTVDLSNRTKHYVWVSFVEIYNEAIYDLLVTTDRTAASKLRIREDPSGNVYVKGATQAFVRTGEEAYDVMVAGKHNLQVHATGVHAHSSRSHCIFTITMLTETESGVRASHVRLCDLAGSERARRTRNTGARMQESRAINSSLHVLERCLHTLRRKQASKQDLVPYRESKLTRLLGSGLSGARGEAVSMVVTLNPAPEYAHETRHVLQLAAVARDIQVNNTIAESVSTLESSCSQDTTVASSAEVTRLRADNERLHYELMQAEALKRKLMEEMENKQEENAVIVKDLVDEARDITEQYYKSQLRSLEERHETEIAELREEYEAKLTNAVVADKNTPGRAMQNKVMQLMKQVAILEEELNAERLAKARMREELLHLRACIEERDVAEKAEDNSNDEDEDAIQLTDSEDDSEEADDLCNDSLEPTFKKEDINRSRLLRQSILNNTRNTCDYMDKTHDTLKDDSLTDKDMTDATYDESRRDLTEATDATYDVSSNDTYNQSMDCPTTVKKITGTADETYNESNNDTYNQSMECPATIKKADVNKDNSILINEAKPASEGELKQSARETYFVSSSNNVSLSANTDKKDSIDNNDTNNLVDTGISVSLKDDEDLKDFSIIDINLKKPARPIETQIDKIKKFAIGTVSTDSSLAQFEMLELEMDNDNKETSAFKYFDNGTEKRSISMSPRKKEKKPYFDDVQPSPNQMSKVKNLMKKHDLVRSPSIVQDEMPENYQPTTINQIMRESFTVTTDVPPLYKNKLLLKMHDSIDPFEEADSPCPNKQDVLKSVDEARKSIAKVSLVDTEKEVKSEIMADAVENEIKMENTGDIIDKEIPKEMATAKEDKIADAVDIDIVSVPKENTSTEITVKSESVNTDMDVKRDILAEVKQEQTNEVDETTENELKTEAELPHEISSLNDVTNSNQTIAQDNNTIDAFENIYKDITAPRATDFELLISDKTVDNANENVTDNVDLNDSKAKANVNEEETKRNLEIKEDKQTVRDNSCDKDDNNHENKREIEAKTTENKTIKYNLRHKTQDTSKTDNEHETTVEHTEKCAPRTAKKSLRLRRKKVDEHEEEVKLKNIVNLQKEFSDVTLGVPAPEKIVRDMPSPDKSEGENQPPMMGVQSCPSKSVTRSRRKLFTPRAEPLDESPPAGSAERVRVPRPSYHRARTRRRLN